MSRLPAITDEQELWPLVKKLSSAELKALVNDENVINIHVRLARLALYSLSSDGKVRREALDEIREIENSIRRTGQGGGRSQKKAPARVFESEGELLAAYSDRVMPEQAEAIQNVLADLEHMKRQERLAALLFALNPVRTEAARGAGYSGSGPHASRLFKRPHVQAAVGKFTAVLDDQFVQRLLYQRERVLQRYEDMADFDPLPYLSDDGIDLERLKNDHDGQVFINSVEVDMTGKRRKVRVNFADQRAANDRLAAVTGLAKSREIDARPPPTVIAIGVFGAEASESRTEIDVTMQAEEKQ